MVVIWIKTTQSVFYVPENPSPNAVARARPPETDVVDDNPARSTYICPACGTPMIIIETFVKQIPRAPPAYS